MSWAIWYRKKPFLPWAPSSFCLTRWWKFAQNKKHCLWASSVPNTEDREFFWWLHLTQKFQHHFFKQNPHTLCNPVKPQGKPLLSYSIDGFPPKFKKIKIIIIIIIIIIILQWAILIDPLPKKTWTWEVSPK